LDGGQQSFKVAEIKLLPLIREEESKGIKGTTLREKFFELERKQATLRTELARVVHQRIGASPKV